MSLTSDKILRHTNGQWNDFSVNGSKFSPKHVSAKKFGVWLGHDWDGRLSSWIATSSIVLTIEGNRFIISIFYIALDWQLDHWSCSWPESDGVWVNQESRCQSVRREMTSPSQWAPSLHVLWQPLTSRSDSSLSIETSVSQKSVHFPFIDLKEEGYVILISIPFFLKVV